MVDALLGSVFQSLNSMVVKEFGSFWGVTREIEKLSSVLSTVCAVLKDAEENIWLNEDRAIKNWLQKLSDASHVLDDVLDEFAMEASRMEHEKEGSRWKKLMVRTSFFSFSPTNVLFRWSVGKKMKDIGERLDEIANERLKFHLRETVGERRSQLGERRQSGSVVTQMQVYGRKEDEEKIVQFLVFDSRNCEDVSIYSIVGMGGIGKTTLAQIAFDNERVKRCYELKVWVCVSENFDVKRVMRAIIESSSGRSCEALDMDPLQKRLQGIFRGKKFLLVLDDVWNEDQEQWDKLKCVLNCGSVGSSILVTTRLEKVAAIMGTICMHHLSGLSEDDCWLLFKQRAFGIERGEQPNLVKVGKEIVRKCGGVPLAAKALGGLMRFKREENEWLSVMQSELWNILRDENTVLPALRLSYFNLPMEQRRCFAFCALFPKNHKIEKKRIIRLWMANGFISSEGKVEVEEVGDRIFEDLYWRSFFQDYKKDYFGNWCFKMHDLVHDLAQSIMDDECHYANSSDLPTKLPMRVRYLASTHFRGSSIIPTSKSLRTLMLVSKDYHSVRVDCPLNFLSLRALDAEHFTLTSISSFITSSKHLRYLNLSYTNTKFLPESICHLQNLQTLELTGCSHLQKLPHNLSHLTSLRHLNIFGCVKLSKMPHHLSRLTLLRTLSIFIVDGKRSGCHLEELEGLNLYGDFEIKGLERVRNSLEAKKANLVGKRNIKKLCLSWGTKRAKFHDIADHVLEALEPSPSLTVLEIKSYEGTCFPHWLSSGILENVVRISLSDCKNCSNLPALNNLPLLKYLYIHQMNLVRYVDDGSSVGGLLHGFMCLENLMIRNLPNLEKLSRDRDQGSEIFPRLSELYLSHCYKLNMLPCIPSLRKLEIWKCHAELLNSIPNLPGLTLLDVNKIDNITSLPNRMLQNLTTLQTLRLSYFNELKEFPSNMLIGLNTLEKLHIRCCDELEGFPDGFFQMSSPLKCITIEYCKKFKTLSESFQYLTALQSLDLLGCPNLETFPNGLNRLSCLRHLILSGHCRSTPQCSPPKMTVLPTALQYLPSLESMIISDFLNLTSLPDWLGNLASLQELFIRNCPDLWSIPTSIQSLNNLETFSIESCPILQERCERSGEEWHKIAHIPNVHV